MKIQELKLFNGLTEDELQRSLVCSQSNIVEYEKDDYIFSQGERPRWDLHDSVRGGSAGTD